MKARALGLVVSLLALAGAAEAGPWGAGKHKVYAKLGYGRLRSTELVTPDGTSFAIPRFSKDELGLYAFYGLTDRVSLLTSVPLLRSANLEDEPDELGRESGIGDVQAGLQVQLGQAGPWVFAARGIAQAPTGDVDRAEGLLPTGSGVWEGEAWLSAGRSFAGGAVYGFVEAGHQLREGLRDGLVYAAQLGWNVNGRLVLAASVRGVQPWSEKRREATGSFVGVGDGVTYLVLGPTAIVKLSERLGVQVDVEGATRERNLATGTTLRVGISYKN